MERDVHSIKRRSPWHDYWRKGTYMLTLVVNGRKPLLGSLVAVSEVSTSDLHARVELSILGRAIRDEEIKKINHLYFSAFSILCALCVLDK